MVGVDKQEAKSTATAAWATPPGHTPMGVFWGIPNTITFSNRMAFVTPHPESEHNSKSSQNEKGHLGRENVVAWLLRYWNFENGQTSHWGSLEYCDPRTTGTGLHAPKLLPTSCFFELIMPGTRDELGK